MQVRVCGSPGRATAQGHPAIRDVEALARAFGMDPDQRREFGDYLEKCKRSGDCGTLNDRGDFTWDEMVE
jgi:hypothetical protein